MAPSEGVNVIDGFSSVQAVKHSSGKGGKGPAKKKKPAPKPAPPPREDAPGKTKPRIGHTAIPLHRELTCYACSYRFRLRGKFAKTFCPKCKQELDLTNHAIEGDFTGTIQTLGTVEIRPGAVLHDAKVTAGDVVLLGDAKGAAIDACGHVELCRGASFDLDKIRTTLIIIGKGSSFQMRKKLHCTNLEIEGKLSAPVRSTGVVTVRPGGLLRGSVTGEHLVVEEGGGLQAKATVRTAPVPANPEKKTSKRKTATKMKAEGTDDG